MVRHRIVGTKRNSEGIAKDEESTAKSDKVKRTTTAIRKIFETADNDFWARGWHEGPVSPQEKSLKPRESLETSSGQNVSGRAASREPRVDSKKRGRTVPD